MNGEMDGDAVTVEDRVRKDLHSVRLDPLDPPAGLADAVLGRLRRSRRRRAYTVVTAAAAVTLAAVGVPTALTGGEPPPGPDRSGTTSTVSAPTTSQPAPTFPAPGGGRQAVHVYGCEDPTFTSYLLDPARGLYRRFPYQVELSPDRTRVAVRDTARTGVADRAELLARGSDAIRWIDAPAGSDPLWSPDGTALLFTSIDKGSGPPPAFTAHRYDVVGGKLTSTPITVAIIGGAVGWAADSRRYLALLPAERSGDGVEPGALQYLNPDGTSGPRLDIQGGVVGGARSYSPSRLRFIADASGLMSQRSVRSTIVAVKTGAVVATLPAGARPIGWYDDRTVISLATGWPGDPAIALVDVATGKVTRTITLAGVPGMTAIQPASTAGFGQAAARFGF